MLTPVVIDLEHDCHAWPRLEATPGQGPSGARGVVPTLVELDSAIARSVRARSVAELRRGRSQLPDRASRAYPGFTVMPIPRHPTTRRWSRHDEA